MALRKNEVIIERMIQTPKKYKVIINMEEVLEQIKEQIRDYVADDVSAEDMLDFPVFGVVTEEEVN